MSGLIKTDREIEAMREGGRMLASVLDVLCRRSEPGLTPKHMSALAAKELKALGGEPAFLGYRGFPDVICISVNEQVQHGIPNNRPFESGDVVNYDFGVRHRGLYTDAGVSVCIGGKPSQDASRLLVGAKKALAAGIDVIKENRHVGDISATIEKVLSQHRLGIVRELVGHSVGHELHEEIEVPNYGQSGTGPRLQTGMTLAIEPIATLGSPRIAETGDGWTLVTVDKSWACQFEHTVLVLPDGAEILTAL